MMLNKGKKMNLVCKKRGEREMAKDNDDSKTGKARNRSSNASAKGLTLVNRRSAQRLASSSSASSLTQMCPFVSDDSR